MTCPQKKPTKLLENIKKACYNPLNKVFNKRFFYMVPEAGLEPARYRYRRILSPLRLPISPLGHVLVYYKTILHLNQSLFMKNEMK